MSTTGFNIWEVNSEVQHHGSTLEFNIMEVNSILGFKIGLVNS